MDDARLPELDEAVKERCASGDYARAATLILERLGPAVLSVIHGRFRDPHHSAEVFSRFSEALWRGLPGFAFRTNVRVWVFTLARNSGNRYLDRELRRERRGVPLSRVPDEVLGAARLTQSRTLPHLRGENHARLEALRATLCDDDRQLLALRLGESLEYSEIACVFLGEGQHSDTALAREAARLRKRMQLLKRSLKAALAPAHETPS
jgi:RNA polymerase sigma-70 factor (ECF subfamily)